MAALRRPLIAGNWKMNCLGSEGLSLAHAISERVGPGPLALDLVLFPPVTLISRVAEALVGSTVAVGGQDCHCGTDGAHTGDISAEMLADAGCSYVIVGHSERRRDHRETDVLVCRKAAAAHRAGLVAVVCVGESEAEYLAGDTLSVASRQVAESVPEKAGAANTVVAYEPVWAIGTGRTPTLKEITRAHERIRQVLAKHCGDQGNIRILYGGSVNAENSSEIMTLPDVDGALVGGASLDADEFWSICRTTL